MRDGKRASLWKPFARGRLTSAHHRRRWSVTMEPIIAVMAEAHRITPRWHTRCWSLVAKDIAGGMKEMAPTDDDQANERESRVEEIMKGYRRDHPRIARRPQDEPPPSAAPIPPKGDGRTRTTKQ